MTTHDPNETPEQREARRQGTTSAGGFGGDATQAVTPTEPVATEPVETVEGGGE